MPLSAPGTLLEYDAACRDGRNFGIAPFPHRANTAKNSTVLLCYWAISACSSGFIHNQMLKKATLQDRRLSAGDADDTCLPDLTLSMQDDVSVAFCTEKYFSDQRREDMKLKDFLKECRELSSVQGQALQC
eukprot:749539-Hanusia_phi.AAC.4